MANRNANHTLSTDTPRRTPARLALAGATMSVSAGLLFMAGGCAPGQSQMDEALVSESGVGPMVISGTPRSDTAAFRSASQTEEAARFHVQEDLGPKPKWDNALDSRGRRIRSAESNVDTSVSNDSNQELPDTRFTPIVDEAAREDVSETVYTGPLSPEELPAAAYTRQPIQASEAGIDLGHRTASVPSTMPVTRMPLPDGKVRLIWHLRSYGGPTVASKQSGNSRREVTLTPGDLAPLLELIKSHLGETGQVLPLVKENKIIITCPADAEQGMLSLMNEIDRPSPQVEIAAKIFEVSHDFDYQQGARLLLNRIAEDGTQTALSSFSTEELLESVAGAPFQGSIVSLMQVFEDAGLSLDAQFELLAEAGLVRVVSSPRLTVAEGQTGYMLAGQELPIQSAEITNGSLKASTQYKPVGVQLYITPQAVGDGMVKLHTVSIVSSISGFTPLPALRGGGQGESMLLNPIIDSREAETSVTVPDGNTLVISGMRMVRTFTREEKVPGLGDLPIIGNFFKSHRSQQRMTDLYFFVTPTLASALD